MPFRSRSQARRLALQALCTFDAIGDDFRLQFERFLSDAENLADLGIESPAEPDMLAFARRLADGAWRLHESLDQLIQQTSVHWSLARMTPVDRNILRLGLFELTEMPSTPPQVVMNEAVELARQFGDTDSPAFVNGVLDAVWRESERQKAAAASGV